MALPVKILEVALEKEEATREKLLEMAMPVMQRERLEGLDMFDGNGAHQAMIRRLLRTCRHWSRQRTKTR